MAKFRSPNYPQLTLREALERVRRVYVAEHTHAAAKEVVVQDLGYSGVNGASAVVIGSLNRYGLLESHEEGLRVTENAVTALELPDDDPAHKAALRALAFNPTLFADLNRQFGNRLPSEASLRHSLIKQGFLPKAAEEVIRVYRDNIELVGEESTEYNESVMPPNQNLEVRPNEAIKQFPSWPTVTTAPRVEGPQFYGYPLVPQEPPDGKQNELKFRLSSTSAVRIVFDGAVTQDAIGKLVAFLNLSKDTFPRTAEQGEERELPDAMEDNIEK